MPFILGDTDIDAQVVLLAAASSTVIQTALGQLKRYMYPFYQDDSDEVLLAEYLGAYGYVYLAAANMWFEMPGRMIAGNIKSFSSGAEDTQFNSLAEVVAFCKAQGKHFESKHDEYLGNNSGQSFGLSGDTVAGGAIK